MFFHCNEGFMVFYYYYIPLYVGYSIFIPLVEFRDLEKRLYSL